MPIKKNAKKALRQAKKRAEQNAIFRRAYKQAVKVTGRAVASGTGDLRELARLAQDPRQGRQARCHQEKRPDKLSVS